MINPDYLLQRPSQRTGLAEVQVADELILLDGWREAAVLSATGVEIWQRLDGRRSLAEIVDDLLVTYDIDRDTVVNDVVSLVSELYSSGLVQRFEPLDGRAKPQLIVTPADIIRHIGEQVADLEVVDSNEQAARLLEFTHDQGLLVNWSPHCGYCARIQRQLVRLELPLRDNGIDLVLFSYGSAESMQTQRNITNWNPRTVLKPPHESGPFVGYGTPAAFHIDTDGVLLSPAARGTDEVMDLATRISESGIIDDSDQVDADVKYLLTRGGSCSPGTGSEALTKWVGTRVYEVGDYHVGLRCASESTGNLLDQLFDNALVDDPHAGHSLTVALSDPNPGDLLSNSIKEQNLLIYGSQILVRSWWRQRVVQALLLWLDEQIMGIRSVEGHVKVNATACLTPIGAVLLPPGLYTLQEELQLYFARYGIAFVDMPHAEIDLNHSELVVPEPMVPHNSALFERLCQSDPAESYDEVRPVGPGRYPLVGWAVTSFAEETITVYSRAQAAAANVSSLLEIQDPAEGVMMLEKLFQQIPGFGISYHSERQLADSVAEALGLSS